MGFWRYWATLCRDAVRETWRFAKLRLAWRALILIAVFVVGLFWESEAGQQGEHLHHLLVGGFLRGVLVLLVAVVLAWLWNLVRAPYLDHLETGQEIEEIRRRLDAKVEWDEGAIGTVYKGISPDAQRGKKRGHYSANFWVYALKPVPPPTRLQVRLTKQPRFWAAFLYTGSEDGLIMASRKRKSKSLKVKLKGRCLEIEFPAPPLSSTWGHGGVGELLVTTRAASPIDIVSAAAAYPKPIAPPADPPRSTGGS
jgi:hypothetical protein